MSTTAQKSGWFPGRRRWQKIIQLSILLKRTSSCVGAAILAGCGANLFPDTYDGYLRLKQEETEYFPDQKSANLYKELYEIFKKRSDLLAECYTKIH